MANSTSKQRTIPTFSDSESIEEQELLPLKETLNSAIQNIEPESSAASILWQNKKKTACLFQTSTDSIYYAKNIKQFPILIELEESYAEEGHWSLSATRDGTTKAPYFEVLSSNGKLSVSEESQPRHYQATLLPTIANLENRNAKKSEPEDQALLLKLYDQVCSQYRALADTRFKLLGLLPAVSIIAWTQLFAKEITNVPLVGLAIATLGLIVSVGIFIYEKRNNELYNDLISRGRKIEEELGVQTGVFRGRRQPHSKLIKHSIGTSFIYWSVLIGWFLIVLWFVFMIFSEMITFLLNWIPPTI